MKIVLLVFSSINFGGNFGGNFLGGNFPGFLCGNFGNFGGNFGGIFVGNVFSDTLSRGNFLIKIL